MADGYAVFMGLFNDVDTAAHAIEELRRLGVKDEDMAVVSGVPYPEPVLGRPMAWERLPLITLAGAIVGMLIGLFFNVATPLMYAVRVGGQPYVALPPTLVLTYEFTMMGVIVSTFLGVLWESFFPSYGPKYYDPAISEGRIGVLFRCTEDCRVKAYEVLAQLGAEEIKEPERKPL